MANCLSGQYHFHTKSVLFYSLFCNNFVATHHLYLPPKAATQFAQCLHQPYFGLPSPHCAHYQYLLHTQSLHASNLSLYTHLYSFSNNLPPPCIDVTPLLLHSGDTASSDGFATACTEGATLSMVVSLTVWHSPMVEEGATVEW